MYVCMNVSVYIPIQNTCICKNNYKCVCVCVCVYVYVYVYIYIYM